MELQHLTREQCTDLADCGYVFAMRCNGYWRIIHPREFVTIREGMNDNLQGWVGVTLAVIDPATPIHPQPLQEAGR